MIKVYLSLFPPAKQQEARAVSNIGPGRKDDVSIGGGKSRTISLSSSRCGSRHHGGSISILHEAASFSLRDGREKILSFSRALNCSSSSGGGSRRLHQESKCTDTALLPVGSGNSKKTARHAVELVFKKTTSTMTLNT